MSIRSGTYSETWGVPGIMNMRRSIGFRDVDCMIKVEVRPKVLCVDIHRAVLSALGLSSLRSMAITYKRVRVNGHIHWVYVEVIRRGFYGTEYRF